MALRIKCKCGKSLKVSSQLADKKLLCPGCKKAFRIPAEKFKQAAATQPVGVKKAPTAPKPPAEAPMPAPVELDLLPDKIDWSSGDLSVSQSDIFDGLIPPAPPAAAAAPAKPGGTTCPGCKQPVAAGAVLCTNCGLNLRTRTYMKASLPPGVAAVRSAPTVSYSTDGTISMGAGSDRLKMDAIATPSRSFWADAFAAFGYPFRNSGNAITFGIVTFIYLLELPLNWVGCYGLVGIFFIEGWLAALYLSVVQDTASGSADLPGIKMEDGIMEDIVKPFFSYLGAFACAFLPAAAYLVLTAVGAVPDYLVSGVNMMLLTAAAIFFWPLFVIMFAFRAQDMLIRLDLIFTTVFRTLLPYLALWLMLLLVGFVKFLPLATMLAQRIGLNLPLPRLPQLGGFAGDTFLNVVDLYFGVVSMRLIGLYYLHFKKRFTLIME